MALKINYEDVSGTIHPEAYVRISKAIIENPVSGLKDVSIDVCVYSSQAARQAGKVPVWGPQGFQVQQDVVDPDTVTMAEIYTWLKSQDQFAGAIDV